MNGVPTVEVSPRQRTHDSMDLTSLYVEEVDDVSRAVSPASAAVACSGGAPNEAPTPSSMWEELRQVRSDIARMAQELKGEIRGLSSGLTAAVSSEGAPPSDGSECPPMRRRKSERSNSCFSGSQKGFSDESIQKVFHSLKQAHSGGWQLRHNTNKLAAVAPGEPFDLPPRPKSAGGELSGDDRVRTFSPTVPVSQPITEGVEDILGGTPACLSASVGATEKLEIHQGPPRLKPLTLEDDEWSNESLDESTCMGRLTLFVCSTQFDIISGAFVLLNSITIGLQTDHMARYNLITTPMEYRIVEYIFCLIFSLEILCRVLVYRMQFLTGPGFLWNIFDTILVTMQLVEEMLSTILSMSSIGFNFSFMRVLRILRLARIIRTIRLLRLIRELRTIVSSIAGSMKSLGWTVFLLFLIVYILGVCLTQIVSDHLVTLEHETFDDTQLVRFYGDLASSLLSLYWSVSGGVDWEVIITPLNQQISVLAGLLVIIFVMFTSLALLNVVTGVFVESALQSAKTDQEGYMLNHMRKLFAAADKECRGMITWEAFERELGNPGMQEFFQSIDVDPSEARGVFHLLDVDESGTIELEELLSGCLGLHGPAKALDLAMLMWETRQMNKLFTAHALLVDRSLHGIIAVLPGAEEAAKKEENTPSLIQRTTSMKDILSSVSVSSGLGATISGEEAGDGDSPRWGNKLFRKKRKESGGVCSCGALINPEEKNCKSCGKSNDDMKRVDSQRQDRRRSSAGSVGVGGRRKSLTSMALADPKTAMMGRHRSSGGSGGSTGRRSFS